MLQNILLLGTVLHRFHEFLNLFVLFEEFVLASQVLNLAFCLLHELVDSTSKGARSVLTSKVSELQTSHPFIKLLYFLALGLLLDPKEALIMFKKSGFLPSAILSHNFDSGLDHISLPLQLTVSFLLFLKLHKPQNPKTPDFLNII